MSGISQWMECYAEFMQSPFTTCVECCNETVHGVRKCPCSPTVIGESDTLDHICMPASASLIAQGSLNPDRLCIKHVNAAKLSEVSQDDEGLADDD